MTGLWNQCCPVMTRFHFNDSLAPSTSLAYLSLSALIFGSVMRSDGALWVRTHCMLSAVALEYC